jgi:hypothetical protein
MRGRTRLSAKKIYAIYYVENKEKSAKKISELCYVKKEGKKCQNDQLDLACISVVAHIALLGGVQQR